MRDLKEIITFIKYICLILCLIIFIPSLAFAINEQDSAPVSNLEDILNSGLKGNKIQSAFDRNANYMYLEPKQAGSSFQFTLQKVGSNAPDADLYYAFDDGEWNKIVFGEAYTFNQKIFIKGNNSHAFAIDSNNFINLVVSESNPAYAGGSIMSLLDEDGTSTEIPYDWCFAGFFRNSKGLLSTPEMPATVLSKNCYSGMFNSCLSLQTASKLPAKDNLPSSCYLEMFANCSTLTHTPLFEINSFSSANDSANQCQDMFLNCKNMIASQCSLNATVLTEACYMDMFNGCIKLNYGPDLPAKINLPSMCYKQMFFSCKKLLYSPKMQIDSMDLNGEEQCDGMFAKCDILNILNIQLNAKDLSPSCYQGMFHECASLESAPDLPAYNLNEKCYFEMFWGCRGLIKAPNLVARELKPQCYDFMFKACFALNALTVGFSSWDDAFGCLEEWLQEVMRTGTLYGPAGLGVPSTRSDSTLPEGWNFESLPKTVFANSQGYSGEYDGNYHSIDVSVIYPIEAVTIEYRTLDSSYSEEKISYKNAGHYTIFFRVSAEGYETFYGNANVDIWASSAASVGFSQDSYTKEYGDKDPDFSVYFNGISDEDKPIEGINYVFSREKGENVLASGGYTVSFLWIKDCNYTFTNITTTLTIIKATNAKMVADPASKLSSSEDPVLTAHMEGAKFDDILEQADYIVNVSDTNDPSIKTLTPSLTDVGIEKFGVNYDIDDDFIRTNTFTIYQSAAGTNFTYKINTYIGSYDGLSHEFSINVVNPSEGATVKYKTDAETSYKEEPPSFTDSGAHTISYEISCTGYTTLIDNATLKINKKDITITANAKEIFEGQASPTLDASVVGMVEGQSLPDSDYSLIVDPTVTGAGTYDIKVAWNPSSDISDNYVANTVNSKLVVKNKLNFTYNSASYTGVYDGNNHSISVSGISIENYTIEYSTDGEIYTSENPSFKNITEDEQKVYFRITPDDQVTYNVIKGSEVVNILPAPLKISANYKEMILGDEPPQLDAVVDGLIGEEKLDSGDYSLECASPSASGAYDITVKLAESPSDVAKNYSPILINSKLFVKPSERLQITFTSTDYFGIYDGQEHSVDINVHSPAEYTITYKNDSEEYVEDKPIYKNITDEPQKVEFKITPIDTRYEIVYGSNKVNIAPAPLLISANYQEIYDGEETPSLTASVSGLIDGESLVDGDYDLSCDRDFQPGTFDIVTTVSASPSDVMKNYEVATKNSKLVVRNKLKTTFSSSHFNGAYDGESHSIDLNTDIPSSIEYSLDGETFSVDKPQFVDATEEAQIVVFKIQPNDARYETILGQEEVFINKVSASIVVDATYKYEGDPDPQFSAKTFGLIDGESLILDKDYELSRDVGEVPGTYEIHCNLINNKVIDNYNIATCDSKFFIMAALAPTPVDPVNPENPEIIGNNSVAQTGDLTFFIIAIFLFISVFGFICVKKNSR